MATIAAPRAQNSDAAFFVWAAVVFSLVMVSGFVVHLAFGRSSFSAPEIVHAHATIFFGWVTIYLTQTLLAGGGALQWHRRLGWVGAGWIVVMVIVGTLVAIEAVRQGRSAPVYPPAYFLIYAPMTIYTFAGLTVAAILLRGRTDWHRRLHLAGTAAITGPGFGRLLPMPLLIPHVATIEVALAMAFPLAGLLYDLRRTGRVHPAWLWGAGVILGAHLVTEGLAASPIAEPLYRMVTAGTPGAAMPPFAYRPIPMQ